MKLLIIISVGLSLLVVFLIRYIINLNDKIDELKIELARKGRIEKQKEKIATNSDVDNFNNSIDMLQKYSTRKN